MSDTRCPTCGKTPTSVRFIESDSECVIGSCECAKKPEPTLAELLAEIRACRAEMRALRDNTERLNVRATGFAQIQTGEAVIPAAYDPFAKPA